MLLELMLLYVIIKPEKKNCIVRTKQCVEGLIDPNSMHKNI